MKRKCDEVFCKFNDLTKSIEYFYKKHNSAFTVAELVVTILVLAFLVFVLLGFMNRNQQKEYDAKNDKTVANIHALIDKASITQTGNSIDRNDVNAIRNIITNDGLNITDLNCDECWGADDNVTPGAADGTKILLNDQTVIAFVQDSGKIYIDANGAKGPNKLRQDIRELDYADTPITPGTIASCQYPRVFHESLCCPRNPNGDNERWESDVKCDICSKTDNEVWTAGTGCDKCASNKWRNNTCCSTTNDSNPNNSKWNETGCDYTCTNANDHENDAKWKFDSTACTWGCSGDKIAQGYHAEYENVTNMTKVTPSPSNGCGYGYACPTDTYPNFRTTACCANLSTNEVWTSASGCGTCKRGSKPSNSSWGDEGTANACNWTCNTNYHDDANGDCCSYIQVGTGTCDKWVSEDIYSILNAWDKNKSNNNKCNSHNHGVISKDTLINGGFFIAYVSEKTKAKGGQQYRIYENTGSHTCALYDLANCPKPKSLGYDHYPNFNNGTTKSITGYKYCNTTGDLVQLCVTNVSIPNGTHSPLSFDLDDNGVTTKDEVIKYDINGDGNLDAINDSADAVLCFDRDKDGVCGKDGSELFGNNTRFGFEDENFKGYADGFDALKALAEHEGLINEKDNKLDENDIKYLEDKWGLRIKKDGYLSEGEKLTDNKITEISTSSGEKHWYENFDDKGNNLMVQDGATFVIDNKTNIFADIWHTITNAISGVVDAIAGIFK